MSQNSVVVTDNIRNLILASYLRSVRLTAEGAGLSITLRNSTFVDLEDPVYPAWPILRNQNKKNNHFESYLFEGTDNDNVSIPTFEFSSLEDYFEIHVKPDSEFLSPWREHCQHLRLESQKINDPLLNKNMSLQERKNIISTIPTDWLIPQGIESFISEPFPSSKDSLATLKADQWRIRTTDESCRIPSGAVRLSSSTHHRVSMYYHTKTNETIESIRNSIVARSELLATECSKFANTIQMNTQQLIYQAEKSPLFSWLQNKTSYYTGNINPRVSSVESIYNSRDSINRESVFPVSNIPHENSQNNNSPDKNLAILEKNIYEKNTLEQKNLAKNGLETKDFDEVNKLLESNKQNTENLNSKGKNSIKLDNNMDENLTEQIEIVREIERSEAAKPPIWKERLSSIVVGLPDVLQTKRASFQAYMSNVGEKTRLTIGNYLHPPRCSTSLLKRRQALRAVQIRLGWPPSGGLEWLTLSPTITPVERSVRKKLELLTCEREHWEFRKVALFISRHLYSIFTVDEALSCVIIDTQWQYFQTILLSKLDTLHNHIVAVRAVKKTVKDSKIPFGLRSTTNAAIESIFGEKLNNLLGNELDTSSWYKPRDKDTHFGVTAESSINETRPYNSKSIYKLSSTKKESDIIVNLVEYFQSIAYYYRINLIEKTDSEVISSKNKLSSTEYNRQIYRSRSIDNQIRFASSEKLKKYILDSRPIKRDINLYQQNPYDQKYKQNIELSLKDDMKKVYKSKCIRYSKSLNTKKSLINLNDFTEVYSSSNKLTLAGTNGDLEPYPDTIFPMNDKSYNLSSKFSRIKRKSSKLTDKYNKMESLNNMPYKNLYYDNYQSKNINSTQESINSDDNSNISDTYNKLASNESNSSFEFKERTRLSETESIISKKDLITNKDNFIVIDDYHSNESDMLKAMSSYGSSSILESEENLKKKYIYTDNSNTTESSLESHYYEKHVDENFTQQIDSENQIKCDSFTIQAPSTTKDDISINKNLEDIDSHNKKPLRRSSRPSRKLVRPPLRSGTRIRVSNRQSSQRQSFDKELESPRSIIKTISRRVSSTLPSTDHIISRSNKQRNDKSIFLNTTENKFNNQYNDNDHIMSNTIELDDKALVDAAYQNISYSDRLNNFVDMEKLAIFPAESDHSCQTSTNIYDNSTDNCCELQTNDFNKPSIFSAESCSLLDSKTLEILSPIVLESALLKQHAQVCKEKGISRIICDYIFMPVNKSFELEQPVEEVEELCVSILRAHARAQLRGSLALGPVPAVIVESALHFASVHETEIQKLSTLTKTIKTELNNYYNTISTMWQNLDYIVKTA